MVALRWITGSPIAALITVLLFLFMASAVSQPIGELPPSKPALQIKITPDIIETPIDALTPPQPVPANQPPIDFDHQERGEQPKNTVEAPKPTPTTGGPLTIDNPIAAPIIKVQPVYPERCRARGAEGEVLVQFDVAADGSVVNARIIESSNSCFDRTVLKTVSGWKYSPANQGGKPAPRYGLVERFSFQITEE